MVFLQAHTLSHLSKPLVSCLPATRNPIQIASASSCTEDQETLGLAVADFKTLLLLLPYATASTVSITEITSSPRAKLGLH